MLQKKNCTTFCRTLSVRRRQERNTKPSLEKRHQESSPISSLKLPQGLLHLVRLMRQQLLFLILLVCTLQHNSRATNSNTSINQAIAVPIFSINLQVSITNTTILKL